MKCEVNQVLLQDGSVIWCEEQRTEISEDIKEYFPVAQRNGLTTSMQKSKDDLQ